MKDIIAVLIILAILAVAIAYIVKAKKKGAKCIGCPAAGCCQMNKTKHSHTADDSETTGCSCGCQK